jgi:hypothetical protein
MRTARLAGLVAAGALALVTAIPVSANDTTMVRVLHASPDAPAVDIWVDGTKTLENVPFKTLSNYLKLPAGEHQIVVVATGTTEPAVIDASPTFEAGKKYTVAAIDFLAAIKAQVYVDNGKAVDGSAKLRVVHLSPDAGAVDVAVKGQTADEAPVQDLKFPNETDYLKLPPATYDFEVRVADTTDVALPLDDVKLEGGKNYSVFAVGSASPDAPEGQGLTVVVGIDGVVAPATDTLGAQGSTGTGLAPLVAMLALATAAIVALGASLRLFAVRNR